MMYKSFLQNKRLQPGMLYKIPLIGKHVNKSDIIPTSYNTNSDNDRISKLISGMNNISGLNTYLLSLF